MAQCNTHYNRQASNNEDKEKNQKLFLTSSKWSYSELAALLSLS